MKDVNFTGPLNADIYIIGEAPGESDELHGAPLTGGSGNILNALLMGAGIDREKCRIGNVCLVRPFKNDFEWFKEGEGLVELQRGVTHLHNDLLRVKPKVIVPLGNYALRFCLDLGQITKRRGSIYWSDEYKCKVIPTIHPILIIRQWDYSPLVLFDFKRIKQESLNPLQRCASPVLVINPSFGTVCAELHRLMSVERVSFDIETSPDNDSDVFDMSMSCIGFSDSALWSICIPLQNSKGEHIFTIDEEVHIMALIKQLLEGSVEKIAQNAQFDMGYLKHKFNISVNNLVFDTMCGMHTMYPELPKSLACLCSIYTRQPYYKDWGKNTQDAAFWRYNALDACVTFEIAEKMIMDMKEFGVWDFYTKHIHPLIGLLLDMQLRGVAVDATVLGNARIEITNLQSIAQTKANELAGVCLNVNSPTQLKEILFTKLGYPVKRKRGTQVVTTDEEALNELSAAYPHEQLFKLIIEIRGYRKIISTYLNAPQCKGRLHTSYNIGGRVKNDADTVVSAPETGRLSSSKSIILNSGTNLQNIPHGICRRMFIPDKGKMFMKVDLSQAEARVVACLAQEEKLIHAFNGEEDVFKLVGSWIFNTPTAAITSEQRTLAKRTVHGLNYGMGSKTFSVFAGIPMAEAKAVIDRFFSVFPNIKRWHTEIEMDLGKCRVLTNPFGRKRQFFGRWGQSLFREAYAHIPQSTVGDVLNYAMTRTDKLLKEQRVDAQMVLQVHDEFDLQYQPVDYDKVLTIIDNAFDIELVIGRYKLKIPYAIEIGHNWEDMKKVVKEKVVE